MSIRRGGQVVDGFGQPLGSRCEGFDRVFDRIAGEAGVIGFELGRFEPVTFAIWFGARRGGVSRLPWLGMGAERLRSIEWATPVDGELRGTKWEQTCIVLVGRPGGFTCGNAGMRCERTYREFFSRLRLSYG
jgi:hypothetical protein